MDIVLVNEPNTVFTVDVNAQLGSSDHCRVDFTIVIELELSDGMADVSAKQLPMNKHYQAGEMLTMKELLTSLLTMTGLSCLV